MFSMSFKAAAVGGIGLLVLVSSVFGQGKTIDDVLKTTKIPKAGICQALSGNVGSGLRSFKCDHLGVVQSVQEIYDAGFKVVGMSHETGNHALVFLVIEERR
jgi:hypothetical protein